MKNKLIQELTKINGFENPKISLEQYITPPNMAADLIFYAHMNQDLEEEVLDLGTGTGILAIGAALTGSKVTAVDKDQDALEDAKENARKIGVSSKINFRQENASDISKEFNTVLMNPPFSQHSNEGINFWSTATSISNKIYGVSPTSNRGGIKKFLQTTEHKVVNLEKFEINLPATYGFHTKQGHKTQIDLIITEEEPKK